MIDPGDTPLVTFMFDDRMFPIRTKCLRSFEWDDLLLDVKRT